MSSVTERRSLSNLATAVLALVAAALVLATLVLASRIVRAPVPTGQLFRYHCARVGLRLVFTRMLPPLARMAALVEFGSRFANEGWGAVYVTAVVEDYFLGEFLDHIRVKHQKVTGSIGGYRKSAASGRSRLACGGFYTPSVNPLCLAAEEVYIQYLMYITGYVYLNTQCIHRCIVAWSMHANPETPTSDTLGRRRLRIMEETTG
ncbi:hypothetical protein DFH07DRAFT_776109 [Mycena maculata]|uniref:Uncharacterized protein n=1 Tax=Mycena maculata TaxID=230809 RepID=A0AAD7IQK8_9AGAR|nr:hypothetical protein DFH07DRAFT_776104 [Mycena maculata]KAJ7747156.1 hypothetical protein DFH07DRAFT_776109 [Mycena maculata]